MNKIVIKVLLLLTLLLPNLASWSQVTKKLDKAQMKSDIDHFFRSLHQHHPNPYYFCSKDSVERERNLLVNSLPDSLSTSEFAKRITTLNHLFDAHTNISLDFIWQDTSQVYIPPIFEIDNNYNLYVKEKYTSVRSKVMSINGQKTTSVMAQFKKYMSNEQIRSNIRGNILLFTYCLPILGINHPYTIELEHNGTLEVINISNNKAYTNSASNYNLDFSSLYKKSLDTNAVQPSNFQINTDRSLAILYYTSCNIDQDSSIQQQVKTFFQKIDSLKIKNLIIDIRNNTGGNTASNDYITKYIKHKAFTIKQSVEERITNDYKQAASSKVKDYRQKSLLHKIFYRLTMPSHIVKIYAGNVGDLYKATYKEKVAARTSGYSGNIFIAQGYNTFSSALDFALWFKVSKRGIIVGDETGEATDCFSNIKFDYLPHSNLAYMVALGRYKFPSGNIATGLKPDRYIKIEASESFLNEEEINQIILFK